MVKIVKFIFYYHKKGKNTFLKKTAEIKTIIFENNNLPDTKLLCYIATGVPKGLLSILLVYFFAHWPQWERVSVTSCLRTKPPQ